jgi:hypothetical protein
LEDGLALEIQISSRVAAGGVEAHMFGCIRECSWLDRSV